MELKKVFSKIDELFPKYLSVWEDICNIESPTDYKEGVDKVGEYCLNIAKNLGFKVEVFPQEISGNVYIFTMNESAKNTPISLSGHMDTVHALGSFGSPAVKIVGDKIYGPGVMDCKGGIVVGLLAMHALKECGYTDRPVLLLLQSDEENSSINSNKETINYICERAKGSVAFLNLEGFESHFKNFGCIERKGIMTYRFTIKGVEAHASLCAELGANAIVEASHKLLEIEKMKDAILTSEWAERWPGARTAGCSPSSPPPSLCSLVLFMPVSPPASFRAGPGDPFPPDTWESSRIPESTQGVLRGNKSTFPGLDGAAIQASGASSWVSRLGHLHVTQRCPAALARPPPPLLGRVSTDLAHGAFFPS